MFESMTDEEFKRHVTLVCHTLAYRRFLRDNPTARRSSAWEYAVANWREFEDRAIDFCTVQVLHSENGRIARDRLN